MPLNRLSDPTLSSSLRSSRSPLFIFSRRRSAAAESRRCSAHGGFDGGCIVHGMLVASLFPSVISSNFPGAIYASQTLQFKLPVYIEDEVIAEVQATNMREHKNKYLVKFRTKCFKSQGLLMDGEAMAILPTLLPTVTVINIALF
ncbi:uncharacterized protein LOC110019122 [Phalaenopsis equestris]|uniref:uncharacterized protein LOC110019122 n=1 Tax=Phalaenopsis equestris TaxID=78828 RepID=UPI0009E4DFDB|nr:uncharacterized protein LOC110019122 [Phalaenopsis equestris]